MNDAFGPISERSRQGLLDEIYFLRDVAGEREQQCLSLRAELADQTRAAAQMRDELELVYASRSWRWTAPLRAFARWFDVARSAEPAVAAGRLAGATQAHAPIVVKRDAGRPWEAMENAAANADLRRLFVDVTELSLHQGRTGVQRVVREISRALTASPPDGFVVEPVAAQPGQPYRKFGAIASGHSGGDTGGGSDSAIEVRAGDVFLGLDHAMQSVIEHASAFVQMRAQGVNVWFVCNDTLPLAHPEWFPPEVCATFKRWFETIARVGTGIICISKATENDVRSWVNRLGVKRERPLELGTFHLGADIEGDESHSGLTSGEQADIARLPDMPAFLMVGTLEPRKGHAQALEAFNQLWANGTDAALVIVGLPGWMTEITQRRIRHHDEFGRRLFWYMDASDAMLEKLYASCTALLAPSEGEGFGLPLIEAARKGLPILGRDLPVFREAAGDHASYFSGRDAASLADAVRDWLEADRKGSLPTSSDISWITWDQSAQELLGVVLSAHWVGLSGSTG